MAFEYDEKGKFFTDVISKDAVLSIIQTHTHQIRGYVHVRKGERLSDELNRSGQFLAVTQAEVYDVDGEKVHVTPFLALNREHIVWLMPAENERNLPEQTGGEQ